MTREDERARLAELERYEQARSLLENPLFQGAFETVERELMQRWKTDASLSPDGREKVFLMVTLLGQVQLVIREHMETGQMARVQLERDRTLRERAANGLRSMTGSKA
ncbi:MAG TPA: hypothetical protein VGH74_20840 [Planctomycetaceae bacterium]